MVCRSFPSRFNACEPNPAGPHCTADKVASAGRRWLPKAQACQQIRAVAMLGSRHPLTERPPTTRVWRTANPRLVLPCFFPPPLLTLVYSHVVSQTEGQMPPQQMSMTSNYTVQRAWWRGCA